MDHCRKKTCKFFFLSFSYSHLLVKACVLINDSKDILWEPTATAAREAGKLTTDLHLSLRPLALRPLAPIPLALSPLAPIPSSIADHLPGQPPLPLCPISSSLHRSSLQTLLSLLIHPPIPAVSLASEAGRLAVGPHSPSCPSPIPQIFYRKLPTAASSHSLSPFQGILVENPAFLPPVDPSVPPSSPSPFLPVSSQPTNTFYLEPQKTYQSGSKKNILPDSHHTHKNRRGQQKLRHQTPIQQRQDQICT